MKFITSIAACRRLPLACVFIGVLALSSCGGGGSAAADAGNGGSTSNNIFASFLDIVPRLDFSWSTSKQTAVDLSLSRLSGAVLGELRVTLSDYSCVDPTGGTAPLSNPIRTANQYFSYSLIKEEDSNGKDEQGATSVTIALAGLKFQFPAATNYVLLEVFDDSLGIALYGKLVEPADLAGLAISLPGPDAPVVASCANPG
jgi:hypothetical protein